MCHMDNVNLCAVPLRYGEVAWEGTQGPALGAGLLLIAMKDWFSLGCLHSPILPTCSHLCLLLRCRR